MNKEDICTLYGVSQKELSNSFKKVQERIKRLHGVQINKYGRGENAVYEIDDGRADLLINETGMVAMGKEAFITLNDVKFMIFLSIIFCPMQVYRGTLQRLFAYLGLKDYNKYLTAVYELVEGGFLTKTEDKDYVILSLCRQKEEEININLSMLGVCTDIAEAHKKRSAVPLLKLWVGLREVYNNQPFTIAELSELTGLSEYQIRENKKLLESADIIKLRKVFVGEEGDIRCIGQSLDINGVAEHNVEERDKVDSLEHLRGDIWK